jgi:hypothetical protein
MPAYRRQARLLTSGMTQIKKALYTQTLFSSVFKLFSGLFDILAQPLHGIAARQHQARNKKKDNQNSFHHTITPLFFENVDQYYTSTVKKETGMIISTQ